MTVSATQIKAGAVAPISLEELDRDELLELVKQRLPTWTRRDMLEARWRATDRRSELVEEQILAVRVSEKEAFATMQDHTKSATARSKAKVQWRHLNNEIDRLYRRMQRLDRRSARFFNEMMAESIR